MTCPHCQTDHTQKLDGATDLGYSRFRCRRCGRRFNERTGTPFIHLEFPTDIVFQVVVFRLLFKLSLRDLVRMFLMRGYEFTHETVRDWEERFAPLLAEHVRRRRKVGRRWYVDETYVKVKGKWSYLYRAMDREGNLVDSMLSATRDMAAAQRFFRGALSVVAEAPQQVTTDGHDSYPRAIREVLGHKVKHRCSAHISIEGSSRTIAELNSDITPCSASVLSIPPSASVEHSRNSGNTSVHGAKESNSSHSLVVDDSLSPEQRHFN